MCGSMVDIQSPTAEIRQAKKEEETTGRNIMSASATQGGHNNTVNEFILRVLQSLWVSAS